MATTSDSTALARVGPVHFQPLEWELDPVKSYFKGKVLNAGCGNRDLTDILKGFGADDVVNYDIESSIPGAIIGSLVETPFEDNSFDAIICNAVLEHVPSIDSVMSELSRVLKPGGYFIAGVPYLQPFHLNPTDFRRYTKDGLIELGEIHGLQTVDVLPVHTIWQTVGWILWEWALERGGFRPRLVYPFIYTMTRLNHKTDFGLRNNANTFQAIYTKAAA